MGGDTDLRAGVADASFAPTQECQPGADRALRRPGRSEERGVGGEEAPASGAPSASLGGEHEHRGGDGEEVETSTAQAQDEGREQGQLERHTGGQGEVIVGLAHTLATEVGARRGKPTYVEIEWRVGPPAVRADGPDQLQVLEEDVAVIPVHRQEARATDAEGAGEVGSEAAVQKAASAVPACVPGQRVEVVLRPDQVVVLQEVEEAPQ